MGSTIVEKAARHGDGDAAQDFAAKHDALDIAPPPALAQDCSTLADSISLADLANLINSEHEATCLGARQTVAHAIRCGGWLLKAKDRVGHGHWGDWFHKNCRLSERTAQAYMRLARHKANPQTTADLTIDSALKALAWIRPPRSRRVAPDLVEAR
jgi:Protein of unknown function (DUF3102)